MLRLQDIMTREVVTVSPELSLRDTMDLFATRHISGAPVVSRGRVVGVVSLTDLAEFAAATPGVPTERPDLAEWGELENPGDWIEDEDVPAAAFFAEQWEDAGADVLQRMEHATGPEWNALEEHTVGEAMNRAVMALPPETPVEHAAGVMRRAAIHRVLVMENGLLLGIVSTRDIADAVADHRLSPRVYVFGRAASRRGS
jgi:CBS domain-containing protein